MGQMRYAYDILVEKPKGKRELGKCRYRGEDNIRTELREMGLKGVGWMHMARDRDQWQVAEDTVMKLRVLKKVGNLLTT